MSGLAAGFIDSIAGGGGLISLAVLLSVGLPPQQALGTNKLQGCFGTLSASYTYIRKGQANLREAWLGIVTTFIGSMAGAWLIQRLNPALLERLIPIMLTGVLIYTLFSKNLGYEAREAVVSKNLFFIVAGLSLGFYDGFFGPGTGAFWTAAMLLLLGYDMTHSAGATRIMNFTSNIVALAIFALGQNVLYAAGLCMALGQFIGARIGSNLAIKKGARFIRPIFLTVVFLTIVRLGFLYYL